MPFVRCPTPVEAEAAIAAVQALRSGGGSALFLFFGNEQPATGASWCKDCVTADPVLRRQIAACQPGLIAYECPVGERSAWKDQPQHPFRLHPAFRLQRIPTLIRFADGREIGRLVEADCADSERVRAMLG